MINTDRDLLSTFVGRHIDVTQQAGTSGLSDKFRDWIELNCSLGLKIHLVRIVTLCAMVQFERITGKASLLAARWV